MTSKNLLAALAAAILFISFSNPSLADVSSANENVAVKVGEIRKSGYLPGEIIAVKIGALVYWQGAIEIDWKDFRKNINPKFFLFKGLTVGERRYFDHFYDIEETIIFLEAPDIRAEKKYLVELPALSFIAKVEGKAGKVAVPKVEIPLTLKPRVEGPFIDHAAIKIGEPIIYRVRSIRLRSDARPQELDRLTFKPFVEVKRDIKKTENSGNLVIEDFTYTLTLFETAGDYKIPAFKFPFGELAGWKVALLPSKTAGKLTVPYTEKNQRVIPMTSFPRLGEALFGVSTMILLLLIWRPVWAGLCALPRFRFNRAWQERVSEAHKSLRASVGAAQANTGRAILLALYRDIQIYLVTIADPTAGGKFSAADARTLREALAESLDRLLLDTFVELEDCLMSKNLKVENELVARLDQSTRAMYAQLN